MLIIRDGDLDAPVKQAMPQTMANRDRLAALIKKDATPEETKGGKKGRSKKLLKESLRGRDEEVFKFQGERETELYQEVEMVQSNPEDIKGLIHLQSTLTKKVHKRKEMYRALERLNLI